AGRRGGREPVGNGERVTLGAAIGVGDRSRAGGRTVAGRHQESERAAAGQGDLLALRDGVVIRARGHVREGERDAGRGDRRAGTGAGVGQRGLREASAVAVEAAVGRVVVGGDADVVERGGQVRVRGGRRDAVARQADLHPAAQRL